MKSNSNLNDKIDVEKINSTPTPKIFFEEKQEYKNAKIKAQKFYQNNSILQSKKTNYMTNTSNSIWRKLGFLNLGLATLTLILAFILSTGMHTKFIPNSTIQKPTNVAKTNDLRTNVLNVYAAEMPKINTNEVFFQKLDQNENISFQGKTANRQWNKILNDKTILFDEMKVAVEGQEDKSFTYVQIKKDSGTAIYTSDKSKEIETKTKCSDTQDNVNNIVTNQKLQTYQQYKDANENKDWETFVIDTILNPNDIFNSGENYESVINSQKFFIEKLLANKEGVKEEDGKLVIKLNTNKGYMLGGNFGEYDKQLNYKIELSFDPKTFKISEINTTRTNPFTESEDPAVKSFYDNIKVVKSEIVSKENLPKIDENKLTLTDWYPSRIGCYDKNGKEISQALTDLYKEYVTKRNILINDYNSKFEKIDQKKTDWSVIENMQNKITEDVSALNKEFEIKIKNSGSYQSEILDEILKTFLTPATFGQAGNAI